MSNASGDYLSEESEEEPMTMAAPEPPTAQQLTKEDLQLMQQMGLYLPDSDSPRGVQIPVEPGQLLMGNGPLPIQEEDDDDDDDMDGYVIEDEAEEEEEDDEVPQTETPEPEQ